MPGPGGDSTALTCSHAAPASRLVCAQECWADGSASDSKRELAKAEGDALAGSSDLQTSSGAPASALTLTPKPYPSKPSSKTTCSRPSVVDRKCGACGTTETPKWRDGSTRWLCNACGLRNVKRVRPARRQRARAALRSGLLLIGGNLPLDLVSPWQMRALSGAPRAARRKTKELPDGLEGDLHRDSMLHSGPVGEPIGPHLTPRLYFDSSSGAESHPSAWATPPNSAHCRQPYSWSNQRGFMGPSPDSGIPTAYATAVPLGHRSMRHARQTEHQPHHTTRFSYAVEPLTHVIQMVPVVKCCAASTLDGGPPHSTACLHMPTAHAVASPFSPSHYTQPGMWPQMMSPLPRRAASSAGVHALWGAAVHNSTGTDASRALAHPF
jgi:hypothetical protein